MTTLEKELNKVGFDWATGKLVVHTLAEHSYSPGWGSGERAVVFDYSKDNQLHDELLHHEYNNGYGSPQCPRFVGEDSKFLYFPVQYDGATWVDKIAKDIAFYTMFDEKGNLNETPYPGG